ncbi:MAG: minor capsid protein [Eubacteriales bacterium]
MSMIKDMKTYLVSKGVSTPIFLGSIPDGETECIGLYRYAGKAPLYDAKMDRAGMQVRCRHENYEEATANARLVCSMLWEIGDEANESGEMKEIDGTKYARVLPVQSAAPLATEGEYVEVVQSFEVDIVL